MKILIIILPLLFCVQDTVKVDTTQKELRLFFDQRTVKQKAEDIDLKLDLLIAKLKEKNDSTKIK